MPYEGVVLATPPQPMKKEKNYASVFFKSGESMNSVKEKPQLKALTPSLFLKVTTSSPHLCEFALGSPENRLKRQEKFLDYYLFREIVKSSI